MAQNVIFLFKMHSWAPPRSNFPLFIAYYDRKLNSAYYAGKIFEKKGGKKIQKSIFLESIGKNFKILKFLIYVLWVMFLG